ncbi:hypothetical protein B9Z55_027648 [Caenorhabditis nigoni]|uniref:Uncharacterized protein n=2 Tax=Caenorhabditis nigoni TaxID=1611254 RepID=A0A2G5SES7_9PELO|nr:hypothetical protein B9Z55_027648 [Caenorhabditis nigoni]
MRKSAEMILIIDRTSSFQCVACRARPASSLSKMRGIYLFYRVLPPVRGPDNPPPTDIAKTAYELKIASVDSTIKRKINFGGVSGGRNGKFTMRSCVTS